LDKSSGQYLPLKPTALSEDLLNDIVDMQDMDIIFDPEELAEAGGHSGGLDMTDMRPVATVTYKRSRTPSGDSGHPSSPQSGSSSPPPSSSTFPSVLPSTSILFQDCPRATEVSSVTEIEFGPETYLQGNQIFYIYF
jgi:hypothetical protein